MRLCGWCYQPVTPGREQLHHLEAHVAFGPGVVLSVRRRRAYYRLLRWKAGRP